jgi:hypothetical protein
MRDHVPGPFPVLLRGAFERICFPPVLTLLDAALDLAGAFALDAAGFCGICPRLGAIL